MEEEEESILPQFVSLSSLEAREGLGHAMERRRMGKLLNKFPLKKKEIVIIGGLKK